MNGSTLIAARGAYRVSRSGLSQFVAPPKSPTWHPVSHSELIDTLHSKLDRRGLRVKEEHYAVQKQGLQLFGTLDLDWADTGEYAAALGLRTGNDKTLSITLVAGLRVSVCSNLCLSGDLIALRRKHTSGLDLPRELASGLDRYQADVMSLQHGVEQLKQTPLSQQQVSVMIYDIFRKKIVPIRMFHPVVHTLQASAPDDGLNKWTVHNALTTHVKTLPPARAFRAAVTLGQFFHLRSLTTP